MNIKIIGVIGALVCVPALADDVVNDVIDENIIETEIIDEGAIEDVPAPRAVVARLSCDEINQRVDELREDVKAYPELAADLEYMIGRQRTQCAARAKRRPVHNYENVNPAKYIEDVVVEEEPVAEEQVIVTEEPKPVVEKTPEELAAEAEKVAENRAKGLCDDGAKPNRYGCCPGEKFKEISQMKFACCPREGDGECIEPRKK
ncbi:MAG: hypothetical protein J5620_02790 [Alphaproteobacteria bacterium]|nr:hypothetical protein [Alphaproteobacteria bacterium]